MARYRRVTFGDRCKIEAFLQAKMSRERMAHSLGLDKSTIYRELARNWSGCNYRSDAAHSMAKARFRSCRRRSLFRDELRERIIELLSVGWSPQQTSARLRLENQAALSHQSIYHHVKRRSEPARVFLRRFNKKGAGRYRQRRRLRQFDDKLSIHQRPRAANVRSRLGDWERDCLYVAGGQRLLVCVDRKARFTKLARLTDSSLTGVSQLTLVLLKAAGRKVHTITNDNGPEMRDGRNMKIPVYHCDPRLPQQRGTVENTIGLLRQYLSRDTDLDALPEGALEEIEAQLNLRPRRCLDYKTPFEVFYKTNVALAS